MKWAPQQVRGSIAIVLVKKSIVTLGLCFSLLGGPFSVVAEPLLPTEKPSEFRLEDPARTQLRQKIAQLIVIGYSGNDQGDAGVKQIAKQIRRREISGVLHLGHNIPRSGPEMRDLIAYMNAHVDSDVQPALLHALDQEGGRIQRLRRWHGVDKVAAAKDMATVAPQQAFDTYSVLACQLAEFGFNWNLGPVVDLDTNKRNPVISRLKRAYDADPEIVSVYAEQFVKAHQACGISTSLKHFPGHGSSGTDSHKGLADISDTWENTELSPYQLLIKDQLVESIMSGHVLHRGIDDTFPASLSPTWIRDTLREDLGYDGLVVTDDLDMRAISDEWGVEDSAILALAAGNDIILIANGLERLPNLPRLVANAILAEIETPNGRLNRDQVDDAFQRVMRFKAKLGLVP